jgi:hypothetical protein
MARQLMKARDARSNDCKRPAKEMPPKDGVHVIPAFIGNKS